MASATAPYPLSLRYYGPALEAGRMSAVDVGRAMVAAGSLIERAGIVVIGQPVHLEVDARFRKGSFGIDLSLAAWSGLSIALMAEPNFHLLASSIFGENGLFWLLKYLKGLLPENVHIEANNNRVRLFSGGDVTNIEHHVYNLLLDREALESAQGVIEPLTHPGIDSLEATAGDSGERIVIDKSDAESFKIRPPQAERTVQEDVSHPILLIDLIVYNEDHKWRFLLDKNEYWAKIEDPHFWDRIHQGEPLPEGTALRVELITRTILQGDEPPQVERRISKVLDIIRGGRAQQLRMFKEDGSNGGAAK